MARFRVPPHRFRFSTFFGINTHHNLSIGEEIGLSSRSSWFGQEMQGLEGLYPSLWGPALLPDEFIEQMVFWCPQIVI